MKKILLSLLVIILTMPAMFAQQLEPMPIDPKVRKGTLPNGLTYYIRENAEPKGQVEFFIAQKVGSMQEEENQRGLAHFLEHMAFNGMRNFPDKKLFEYLEGIGVRFGYNLNAYTSMEETVYNISAVPTTRPGIIDSCLLILRDWADGLSLTDKDIDDERGVIREEYRTGRAATLRIYETILPEVYPDGNRYGYRLPIGTLDVINNFKYNELRDYYHKWYRPDHQGIIVVGDINADEIEAKIKDVFGPIPTPATPSELAPFPVEPNEDPIVAIGTDPEMTQTQVSIYFKYDPLPKEVKLSMQGLVVDYMTSLASQMLNARFQEITEKANAPFLYAGAGTGMFFLSKSMDAFSVYAGSKEGGMATAFAAILAEIARVDQHGFTQGELQRAQADYMSSLERMYKEREKRKSQSYASEYARNFTQDEPIPSVDFVYSTISQIVDAFPADQMLAQVNMLVKQLIQDNNIVVIGMGPQKEGLVYPTKEELTNLITEVMETEQEPYKDEALNEPLMTTLPKKGSIKKTEDVKLFEAKQFTLSNGIKVIIKPTDFKDDEIRFSASSFGGNSLFKDADMKTFRVINEIATVGGVGNFSSTNLSKALAGKQAWVNTGIGTTTENISGGGSPKDLETIMQLIYLHATAPRFDQEAYESWVGRMRAQLENAALNPMMAFSDTLTARLYGNQPRAQRVKLEDLDQIDYKKAIELYKDRYKDMSDFTFTFVGNIDEATFIPLMEQYIASLPGGKRKEMYKDVKLTPLSGKRVAHFDKKMETIKSTVATVYTGYADYTAENVIKFQMLKQIMDLIYTEEIREKEGGTYGVASQVSFERYPKGNYSVLVYFDTDPNLAEKLLGVVYRELNKLAEEGPSQVNFDKVVAYMLKDAEEKRRDNGTWLGAIQSQAMYNMETFTKREELVKNVKPSDIQDLMKLILSQQNLAEIVMTGAAE